MIKIKSYALEIMHSFLYFIPFLLMQVCAKEENDILHQISLLISFLIFMILTSFLLFSRVNFFRRNMCLVFSVCNLTIIILLFSLNNTEYHHHIFFKGIYYHYLIDITLSKMKRNSIFWLSFIVLLSYFICLTVINNSFINWVCLFYLLIHFIQRIIMNRVQTNFEKNPSLNENIGTIFFNQKGKVVHLDKKWKDSQLSKKPKIDKKDLPFKTKKTLLSHLSDFKLADIEKKLKYLQSLKGHPAKSIFDVKENFEKLITKDFFRSDSSKSISLKMDEAKTVSEKLEVILPELSLKKSSSKLNVTDVTTICNEKQKEGWNIVFNTFYRNLKEKIACFLKEDIFSIFKPQEFILADSFHVTNKSKELMKLNVFRINNSKHKFCIKISKSNEAEINQILNEVKEIFSGIITSLSHELKTPMNCSLNLLEILANSVSDEIFDEFIVPIIQSTKHLKLIISDLIDYSNIISGKFCLDCQSFQLEETLSELVKNLMMEKAKIKGVDIKFEYNLEKNQNIYSDGNRIKQIVFNLLSNAKINLF